MTFCPKCFMKSMAEVRQTGSNGLPSAGATSGGCEGASRQWRSSKMGILPKCMTILVVVAVPGCLSKPSPWLPDGSGMTECWERDGVCQTQALDGREEDVLDGDRSVSEMKDGTGGSDSGDWAEGYCDALLDLEVPDSETDTADVPNDLDSADGLDLVLPTCPNGVCDPGENKDNCPADCCSPCGDGICDSKPPCEETCPEDCCYCGDGQCGQCPGMPPETVLTCAEDCSTCGDGVCSGKESVAAGNPNQCLVDCCGACGDKICKGGECHEDDPGHEKYCLKDCEISCGNGLCEGGEGPANCPQDCDKFACGNHVCEPGESPAACPEDCAGSCGDCECNMGESNETCPSDCGFCGDGICSTCANKNETTQFCPQDCCDDGNSCTDDISILLDGGPTCSHVVNDLADCEVDLPCTIGDYCEDGKCKAGNQEVACDDGNPCTSDWCNQITGGCQFDLESGGECEDGDPCTVGDECLQGECQAGNLDDCDDGNQCTTDACLSTGPITGCVNQPKADGTGCDKDPCGEEATCQDGQCMCP